MLPSFECLRTFVFARFVGVEAVLPAQRARLLEIAPELPFAGRLLAAERFAAKQGFTIALQIAPLVFRLVSIEPSLLKRPQFAPIAPPCPAARARAQTAAPATPRFRAACVRFSLRASAPFIFA